MEAVEAEGGANLKEGWESESGRGCGAMGIESAHVDDEGCFGGTLALDKDFGIGEARVEGHQPGRQEGIKHCLHQVAVGWFLGRGAGVCEEEATGGHAIQISGGMGTEPVGPMPCAARESGNGVGDMRVDGEVSED